MNTLEAERMIGQTVRIWPYARGLYPRDTLYRLWRVIEECGAGPKLFWGSHDPATIHSDLTAFVKFFDDTQTRCLLVVTTPDAQEIAGAIWFDDFVPQYRCFGSIFIRPKYAGAPAMEAVHLALNYAFTALDVRQVWGVTPWKTAKALCQRCGFDVVATLPGLTQLDGIPRDVTILRKMRES